MNAEYFNVVTPCDDVFLFCIFFFRLFRPRTIFSLLIFQFIACWHIILRINEWNRPTSGHNCHINKSIICIFVLWSTIALKMHVATSLFARSNSHANYYHSKPHNCSAKDTQANVDWEKFNQYFVFLCVRQPQRLIHANSQSLWIRTEHDGQKTIIISCKMQENDTASPECKLTTNYWAGTKTNWLLWPLF